MLIAIELTVTRETLLQLQLAIVVVPLVDAVVSGDLHLMSLLSAPCLRLAHLPKPKQKKNLTVHRK